MEGGRGKEVKLLNRLSCPLGVRPLSCGVLSRGGGTPRSCSCSCPHHDAFTSNGSSSQMGGRSSGAAAAHTNRPVVARVASWPPSAWPATVIQGTPLWGGVSASVAAPASACRASPSAPAAGGSAEGRGGTR